MSQFSGRQRVNMANIYFKQKNYAKAIQCYRLAFSLQFAFKEFRYIYGLWDKLQTEFLVPCCP